MKHINDESPKLEVAMKVLTLIIETQHFEWSEQYITGLQVKEKIGAPLDSDLFLAINEPWEDEPVSNETRINLARPGIERFFFKNVYYFTLNEEKYYTFKPIVTGYELLKSAGINETQCYKLYHKLKGCDLENVRLDDIVNLSKPGIERFVTKEADTFTYTVDGEHEMTDKKMLSATDILVMADIDKFSHYLILTSVKGDVDYAWNPDDLILMDCRGMTFISKKWEKTVNIEEYGKFCKPVPPARTYQIKVDKQYHIFQGRFITQTELIALGGKPNVKYDVYKFLSTNPKPIKIGVGESVDLIQECLVRFVLQPKEQTEGKETRKQFVLPEEDIDTLEKLGLYWECITSGSFWVIVYDYPIPDGYNVEKADVALMIPPSYPATQIDMAYFFPSLSKANGREIGALAIQSIDGRVFQRWSRHRQIGEWTPGVDCIATHLCLVDNWLVNELKK